MDPVLTLDADLSAARGRDVLAAPPPGSGATRGGLFGRPGRRRPSWAPPPETQTPILIEAFPRVELPQEVTPGQRFTAVIGLAAQAQAMGGPQERVRFAAPSPTVDLVVQVVADRFDAPEGIRRTLTVVRNDPHSATVEIPLVAPASGSFPWRGMVEVEYSVSGVPVGRAWRELVVSRAASPSAPAATVGGSALSPVGAPPADLTVTILEGADPARLVWTFITPHDVPLPEGQVVSTLPVASAQSFALGQIKDLSSVDGTSVADNRIRASPVPCPERLRLSSGRSCAPYGVRSKRRAGCRACY